VQARETLMGHLMAIRVLRADVCSHGDGGSEHARYVC
jgi:hypothetical protein